jgi:hypothetical protein
MAQRKVLQPRRSGFQHRDGVLAALARKQSRRLGDEPVQTLSVIKTYQHRQFDTQRVKNALGSLLRSGTANVFYRQNSKFARLGVQERFFFPSTKPLHEPAPAMNRRMVDRGRAAVIPTVGQTPRPDAEAR